MKGKKGCQFCLQIHTRHCLVSDLKRRILRLTAERDDLMKACEYLSTEVDRHMEALKITVVSTTAADAVEADAASDEAEADAVNP